MNLRKVGSKTNVLMMLFCILFLTSACGSTVSNNATAETAVATSSSEEKTETVKKTEPVKVVWWHSMSGGLGEAVDKLVADFNSSQENVQVEAVFQGTYDESLNKLKAAMDSDSSPALMQVYEIGSRFMIDTDAVTPVQTFIDQEKYDISSLEANILGYYTFDNQLYSMPFNTSNPILYYNKDAFKAAGLDPENPPKTYEELAVAAKALTSEGQTGASFAIYGWFIEQLLANQGVEFINNGNGRTTPATSSLLNSEASVATLTWWKQMLDDKSMMNLGRKTDDTKKAFAAGQIAMTLDSTASLRGIVSSADGKFEVGTGFLPKPEGSSDGGVVVGGASLWIMNNKSQEEQQGAWEFIKFLAEPATQAYWHVNTGYFPITQKAYDEQIVKDNLTAYPQFQTAIDQLHQTKLNLATQGAVMGVFPEARQLTETAIEEVLNDSKSPQEALDDAAKAISSKIEEYNLTVK
ncbi:ABC transporter substrate-binding protein [Paenibacillus crassostreae]|uniref:ABC transporter substrate-binding protein n=2 Tax=Paenibacillus crassostreae TaxID=1763538 RepID=A0A167DVE1_9BACL|nr:ABC transporter substrate-binding protein [Paenibacillus crassostreae]AOZ91018.1 ABC transporter substrate-binding protein [Paenibacillus crassostreae]OAB74820.1 ABC transporter substrate-binding protein [Paenibacillus crassostreae]